MEKDMATTVDSAFREFQSNLNISDIQRSTISASQQALRDVLDERLFVLDSFLSGSYARSTMIAPLASADVDIFIVLDQRYQRLLPQKILSLVANIIRQRYPVTDPILTDGQAVVIKFNAFTVDVIPTCELAWGGYLITDRRSNKWIPTNPKAHDEIMSEGNKAHDGKLIPLVKMIKAWNKVRRNPFKSLYLELLALDIFCDMPIYTYPEAIRYFFEQARFFSRSPLQDSAGFGEKVYPLRNIRIPAPGFPALTRFQNAYNFSCKAFRYLSYNNMPGAFGQWKSLFRNYFPNYG
jgi:hypothetical protein